MHGWTGHGKRRVAHQLSLRLFGAVAAVLAVLYGIWIYTEISNFERAAERVREDMLRERKGLLQDMVQQTVRTIDYQRRLGEDRVQALLRQRIDNAVAMAQNLWGTYADRLPRPQVEEIIREALRTLRYDEGRGYLFAFDGDLTARLMADRATYEGRSMAEVKDADGKRFMVEMKALADAADGEAFHTYRWTSPMHGDEPRRKLSYVRKVEPLGWYIGTGEYLADMEAQIQAEVTDWLGSIRFARDGYIFGATWEGRVIAGPGLGRHVIDLEDPAGTKVVQKLIALAQDGGGFVEYLQPQVPEASGYRYERKLSYVLPVPEWGWYVGAGVYIDDIEAQVTEVRAELGDHIRASLLKGLTLFLLFGIATYLLSRRATASLGRDVAALQAFFLRDGRDPESLNPDAMRSRELDTLARAARSMALSRDSAEEVLAERSRQLERVNADLERFAWIASHDLQEPLRNVASFLQLLERKLGPRLSQEEAEYISFAVDGARRMRKQITSLMAYARLSAEGLEIEPVPLADLVAEVQGLLDETFREPVAEIEVGDLPIVEADKILLGTVFQNLLTNCGKFRHPERPLRVRISAEPCDGEAGAPMWCIRVADNGQGIPPAYRGDAFALLKRLHGQEIPGTGVGLAMVRKLVTAHGGEVGIDDGLDGQGITVWFTLPVPAAS